MRIGWLTSAKGEGSQKLLDCVVAAISSGFLKSEISFVYLDREPSPQFHTDIPIKAEICEADIYVLAGYMSIVDDETLTLGTFINVHPALPNGPVGTWRQVNKELLANNHKTSGVTIHYVTRDLDRGDTIIFQEFPIEGFDETQIRNKTLEIEGPLLVEALRRLETR